jgi:hypothetical protein
MSKQQIATRVVTVTPSANITAKRAVTMAHAQAGANSVILGIADEDILAGTSGRVVLGETAIAEAGAAINGSEQRLMTDAQGRLIPWTATNVVAAILKPGQTASTAGQFVEVYPRSLSSAVA